MSSALKLNTLQPATGARKSKTRLGRGIGSTKGKTCGRGHKGQKSRSGGGVRVGFEGGQFPLAGRVPKFGFTSRKSLVKKEIRLSELNKIKGDVVDLLTLKQAGLIDHTIRFVKIFLSGELKKAVKIKGIPVSKGAKLAVETLGGSVEE